MLKEKMLVDQSYEKARDRFLRRNPLRRLRRRKKNIQPVRTCMNDDSKVFVDTNVLVYSRDSSEPVKQKQALAWMTFLWDKKNGRISYQVLQEFYMTVTGKLQPGLRVSTAREDVVALLAWNPLSPR